MIQAELIAALQLLADAPDTGTRYERRYRRVRLQKTRHNVFYEIDRKQDVLTVVAVWGMPKGTMPKL
jgi:plasmid stabilization system protein ParE